MGAFHAWVWRRETEPVVTSDEVGPGPGWERVGEVESNAAPEIYSAVQRSLGIKEGRNSKTVRGYLSGSPDERAVQEVESWPSSFYLAFGPLGVRGSYLHTAIAAKRANLGKRPPEAHPGLIVRPIPIGVAISNDEHGHFKRDD